MPVRALAARTSILALALTGLVVVSGVPGASGVTTTATAAGVRAANAPTGDFDDLPTEATCTISRTGPRGTVLKPAILLFPTTTATTVGVSGADVPGTVVSATATFVIDHATPAKLTAALKAGSKSAAVVSGHATDGLAGAATNDTWTLSITNPTAKAGTLTSWSIKVVYDCDLDNDTWANKVDNCPEVDNFDQRDTDRDGLGDACDPDIDGDKVANATDNCPSNANANQRDMNGNGLGDPCDPDADSDGYERGDACPLAAAYNDTGCPKRTRAASFGYRVKVKRFQGRLTSPLAACRSRQVVHLMRVMPGKQRAARVGTVRTTAAGNWVLRRAGRKPGKFFVEAPLSFVTLGECRNVRSKVLRVRR